MKEFQQTKLYNAESLFWRLAHEERPDLYERVDSTQSRAWCDKVHRSLVKAGFPARRAVEIVHSPNKRGGGYAVYNDDKITVSRLTTRYILLHEQCHLANDNYWDIPGHGVEFAAAVVAALDALGVGDHMRTAMREKKVAWAYGQRAKEVTAKAKWLLRENGPGRLKVMTRRDSPLGQQALYGRATRGREGITFVGSPHRSIGHGLSAAIPEFVPYDDLAYVEAY